MRFSFEVTEKWPVQSRICHISHISDVEVGLPEADSFSKESALISSKPQQANMDYLNYIFFITPICQSDGYGLDLTPNGRKLC